MFGKPSVGLFLIVTTTVSATSHAQTIYNDGQTHTISGTSGPVIVEGGSTLNVIPPALISGGTLTRPLGYTATIFGDSTSTINLSGGQVMGAVVTQPPGAGNVSGSGIISYGLFTATGGLVQGAEGNQPNESGGWGLLSNGSVQISGGTFLGGSGFTGGGAAVIAGGNDQVLISGGTFQAGASTSGFGSSPALTLQLVQGTTETEITGGNFLGASGNPLLNSSLYYQAQYQTPGDSSALNISGGVFSDNMQIALYIGDTLSFIGRGFAFNGGSPIGTLTGTLADGNTINTTISMYNEFSVQTQTLAGNLEEITFTGLSAPPPGGTTPEPTSIEMLAIGLLGLVASRAYRSRRRLDRGKDAGGRLRVMVDPFPQPITTRRTAQAVERGRFPCDLRTTIGRTLNSSEPRVRQHSRRARGDRARRAPRKN